MTTKEEENNYHETRMKSKQSQTERKIAKLAAEIACDRHCVVGIGPK